MTTLNRVALLSTVAAAVQNGLKATMIQSIGLAQLALTGDITESDRLQLVGLSEVPAATDKVKYNLFKYSGKLVNAARQVLNIEQKVKDKILAVDLSDTDSIEAFQVVAALKGHYITTAAGFNGFISENFTAEAKEARAKLEAEKANKKTEKTATATATDTVSHEAGQQAAAKTDADNAAVSALADLIADGDVIGKALKMAADMDKDQAALSIATAWKADRTELLAQLSELTAKYQALTAPRKTQGKAAQRLQA